MIIPDYISPIVGYRVWRWKATGLQSLNGVPWLPGRPLVAGCGPPAGGTIVGRADAVHGADELPHSDCTCGVYAAKNLEHLRQIGYAQRGIHGEVYLWGTVVEHKLGWRAQFAYPKNLFLPPDAIPFKLSEIDARLKTLIAFGADIFILGDHVSIRFWTNDSGFDAAGVDYLLKTRQEYYIHRQRERTLKKGDRVAVLGQGIAVVEHTDDQEALVVLGKKLALRIALKDIVLNQQYMRWECEANNARGNNALRKP
ncbi:MAG: hypothetical protein LAO08_14950 [Acidobacteriia bacterium]|nr:hypothetical protein [Terriglobia bacterium]